MPDKANHGLARHIVGICSGINLRSVVKPVAVTVLLYRIGLVRMNFVAVVEAVIVRIRVIRVGAVGSFLCIAETVSVPIACDGERGSITVHNS